MANARFALLDTIPAELVSHVLTSLDACALLRTATTCKTLRALEAQARVGTSIAASRLVRDMDTTSILENVFIRLKTALIQGHLNILE